MRCAQLQMIVAKENMLYEKYTTKFVVNKSELRNMARNGDL